MGREAQANGNFRLGHRLHLMITRRTFVAGAAATLVAVPRLAWTQEMRRIAFVTQVGDVANMTEAILALREV